MLKIGTTLVKERQLHLNASHGEGELAEFARRTVWCVFSSFFQALASR